MLEAIADASVLLQGVSQWCKLLFRNLQTDSEHVDTLFSLIRFLAKQLVGVFQQSQLLDLAKMAQRSVLRGRMLMKQQPQTNRAVNALQQSLVP